VKDKFSKILHKSPLTSIILTSIVFFLTLLPLPKITIGCIALYFLTCGSQLFLGIYEKLDFNIIKMEKKKRKTSKAIINWGDYAQLGLILTPVAYLLAPIIGWIYFILCAAPFSKSLLILTTRLLSRKNIHKATLSELECYRPEVAVYVTGMREVAYQINQWLPVLERMNVKIMIIAREGSIFDDMPDTSIPVFTAKDQRELEILLGECASLKTVLYPANTMKNVQALRHSHLNHYFINHGESDKAVNQSKFMMAYDKLLLAGPLSEKRLRNAGLPLRNDQVEFVGRPQAELLLDTANSTPEIKTVLYAPTWEGYVKNVDYSSIGPLGYEFCKQLLESGRYTFLFKPHPYTGKVSGKKTRDLDKLKALCERHGAQICSDDASLHELMNQSDILICDISSVLNEYLVTKKPILLCKTSRAENGSFLEEFPSSRAATVIETGQDVTRIIAGIENRDEQREERARIRRASLGEFTEGALARFAQVLDDSVANKASGEEG
jgi:hypothetical protein